MFKKILVPLGDSSHTQSALENACELAKHFDSEIHCLYITDTEKIRSAYIAAAPLPEMDIMVPMDPVVETEIVDAVQKELVREEQLALEFYKKWKEKYSDLKIDLEETSGIIHDEIISRQDKYDVIVMGKSVHEDGSKLGATGDSFKKVVHKSKIPVLACTYTYLVGVNLLACYDGNPPAKRALDYAIKFAKNFKVPLNILTTWWDKEKAASINKEGVKIAEEQGVEVIPDVQHRNTVGTIIASAEQMNINFMFMGAYGDNPIKDFILGSTTDQVLSGTGCPTLLCR